MWGDPDHIKKLKEAEAWPDFDAPDAKAIKAAAKAEAWQWKQEQKALKAQGKAAHKIAKQRLAAELADLKATEWEAKAAAKAEKERHRALSNAIKAEQANRKAQRRADEQQQRYEKEAAKTHWQGKGNSMYTDYGTNYSADYTWTAAPSRSGSSGCTTTIMLIFGIFVALIALYFCLCAC